MQIKYVNFSHLNYYLNNLNNLNNLNDLNVATIELQKIIYAATNKLIIKRKSSEKSKS